MSIHRARVVIVGGGFAGINAAHALRRTEADIVIVDRDNYHTFQPLLYQVGTAYLAPEEVGAALRAVFRRQRNVSTRVGDITGVDWNTRTVRLADGDELPFDYLILTAGAQTNYFGIEGMEEHSWPLYTLADAIRLRMHLLGILQKAKRGDPLAVVVVGGGPTGVEMAAALSSMAGEIVGPPARLHVVLVEMAPRLLPGGFHPRSSDRALADLRRRGVEVRLGTSVATADEHGVQLKSGERIEATTVVWAAGVRANDLTGAIGVDTARHGRIVVDEQLRVPGHDRVFAAGDVAAVPAGSDGDVLPMLAPVAIQTGRHAGAQIARAINGEPGAAFRFRDKGMMAVLGRGDAVAEIPLVPGVSDDHLPRLRFGGRVAWLLWLVVHIVYLIGFRNRLKVLVDWGWNYFTSRGAGAILVPIDDLSSRDNVAPSDQLTDQLSAAQSRADSS